MKYAVLSIALLGCEPRPDYEIVSDVPRDLGPSRTDVPQLASDNATFAVRMYQTVAADPGNLFLSPHSVSSALAMTFAGVHGQTASEMVDALELRLPPDRLHVAFNALDLELASRPATFVTANSLWGQEDITWDSTFLDTLARNYGAGLNDEDFAADPEAARRAINDWVADRTADSIPELFAPGTIDHDSRLVLANAIRFQANWSRPFQTTNTAPSAFFVGDTQISVPAMIDVMRRSNFIEGAGYRAIELPYGEDPVPTLTMVIVEPDDLSTFEPSLGPALVEIFAGLAAAEAVRSVDLTLPKFRYRASLDLTATLRMLGMVAAFSDAADFSGMTDEVALKIKSVVHEGIVGIDERGTDVAAATGVALEPINQPPSATFVIDHPFIFIIRDRPTGAILFMGRVVDPSL